jgi:hypothetical protein
MPVVALWVLTPCWLIDGYRNFRGTYCLYLHSWRWKKCVPPKHWFSPHKPHGVTTQNTNTVWLKSLFSVLNHYDCKQQTGRHCILNCMLRGVPLIDTSVSFFLNMILICCHSYHILRDLLAFNTTILSWSLVTRHKRIRTYLMLYEFTCRQTLYSSDTSSVIFFMTFMFFTQQIIIIAQAINEYAPSVLARLCFLRPSWCRVMKQSWRVMAIERLHVPDRSE